MTVKTRKIRQKEPKGERTFGADCTRTYAADSTCTTDTGASTPSKTPCNLISELISDEMSSNEGIYMFENFITLMIFSIVKRVHVLYIMYLYDTS